MNIWNKKAPIIRSQTLTQLIKSYFKLGKKKKVSIPPMSHTIEFFWSSWHWETLPWTLKSSTATSPNCLLQPPAPGSPRKVSSYPHCPSPIPCLFPMYEALLACFLQIINTHSTATCLYFCLISLPSIKLPWLSLPCLPKYRYEGKPLFNLGNYAQFPRIISSILQSYQIFVEWINKLVSEQ